MKLRRRRRTKWFRLRGDLTNLPSKKFQVLIEDATAGCVITNILLRAVLWNSCRKENYQMDHGFDKRKHKSISIFNSLLVGEGVHGPTEHSCSFL